MMLTSLHFLLVVASPLAVVMATTNSTPTDTADPPLPLTPVPFPHLLDPPDFWDNQNLSLPMTHPHPPQDPNDCQSLIEAGYPLHQLPWFCACSHCNQGPKGDRGDRGMPGRPGSPGRRGLTGLQGRQGFVGAQGIKGQKGDDGEKGARGLQGAVGPKGARGFKGEKGERGFEGRPGDAGPKGDDGVCPDNCESSMGPPGTPGLPGPAGARGLPGAQGPQGPKGMKGNEGEMGPTGAPGGMGEKGEQGLQGDCNCTDGADGAPGQKGDKGDKGDQGDMGPRGSTGLPGDKGDMGKMGMSGPPGPCAPIIQSAFTAALTSSYPAPFQPVVFDHVFVNLPGNYNPENGVYTVPVNGTYVFSYHLTVYSKVLVVGLFYEGIPAAITTDPAVLGTTSHSVVLHLFRGDEVWIQVKDENSNGMYANSEASSTFSGFLLHPDSCDLASLRTPFYPKPTRQGGYPWPQSNTTQPLTTSTNGEPN